jgi:aspartate/tyrosine/aromatic aminotransferase
MMHLQAEQSVASSNKEYAPISGVPEFCSLSVKLALGDDNVQLVNNTVNAKSLTF